MCNPETFFFLYHIQIRLQEQRQTGTRQVFISTKHIILALSEKAMDFYICKRKEKLLLQNNTDMFKSVFTKLQLSHYQHISIIREHNGTLTN